MERRKGEKIKTILIFILVFILGFWAGSITAFEVALSKIEKFLY